MAEEITKAKPIQGKKKVLMFRLLKERPVAAAQRLALQIQHTIKEEPSVESTATKDGNVASSGGLESSIELEALASDTDTNRFMQYAVRENLELEVWEINFDKPQLDPDTGKEVPGKFEAQYGTGVLDGWETPAEVEGSAQIKSNIVLNDKLVLGWATVSEQHELEAKSFFYDTVKAATPVEPLALWTSPTGDEPEGRSGNQEPLAEGDEGETFFQPSQDNPTEDGVTTEVDLDPDGEDSEEY